MRTYLFGIVHVRDDAVGEDEQNEVVRPVRVLLCKFGDVPDDRREIGRPVQGDLSQAAAIRSHHLGYTVTVRTRRIHVNKKFMRYPTVRHLGAEAQHGKLLVSVVVLEK